MANKVFIATSLDGYIADKQGGIDWLHSIPNPDQEDMGYTAFMSTIDALIIGRNTFETVSGFDIDWPYTVPVFVLSNSLSSIDEKYEDKVNLIKGDLREIVATLKAQGYENLYIDGGNTIQHFLQADLIDEIILTTIPIVLGGGVSLFGKLTNPLNFKCVETKRYLETVVQSKFVRDTQKD